VSTFEPPVTDDSGQCPHFEEVDEKRLRQLFSKVAAVRSEDYELFKFTHRPMEVFRGTSARDAPTWTEDRIYQEFSEDRNGNFAVVIEGEVGTGKSELCAYLSHRLRLDNRPLLHIDKDDDLMTILSERIPEFYEEHFDEELSGASEFKNLRDDIKHNPQTVANNATSGAILNLRRLGYEVETDANQENDIRDFVAKKLVQLVERGKYDQKVQFVGEKEFEQEEFLQIFAESVDTDEAVSAFNDELWREIRSRYDTASLDDVLEQVGNRFEDTRPVLVFEDFSIAAMEAEKLRNYMERDKGSDNWDFIVAGTRDSTEVLHTRTAEDRFEFFQTNEQDSNSVLFLNEKTAVDFVRPYLGYFKSHDDSVQYDREGEDFELKPAPSGSICAQCGFCDESFRDLFPFNEQFLKRIYAALDESEKSPRELIMTVFEALYDFYDGMVNAPSSAGTLKELNTGVTLADEVFDEAEEFADLACWYGTDEGRHISVDRRFMDAFGFNDEGLPDAITVTSEEVRVAKEGDGPGPIIDDPECPSCKSTDLATHSDGRIVCRSCGEEIKGPDNPLEAEIKDHKQKVGGWLSNPQKYPDTNMYVRRGLKDLLEKLTDEFRLYEGQPLFYNLSSQKDPFVYPDSNEAPDPDQIIVDREDFQRSDLRQLVEFGVRRVEQPRSANYEKMYERIGTQLVGCATQWRQRIFETQLEGENVLYSKYNQNRFDFEDFLLSSYAVLCLLDDPTKPITAKHLNQRYQNDEELSVDSDLATALRSAFHDSDDYPHLIDAMEDASYVESLVGELFGVSANALDVPRVRQRLERNSPAGVLDALARKGVQNIDARVRFDTGHNVKDFADAMYDVWKVLDEFVEYGYDEETVEYVTSTVAGTDMNDVEEKYDNLKTYDSVDPEFQEALGKVCRHSNQDVQEATATAELANELRKGGKFDQVSSALASQKLSNSSVVERFEDVPFAGKGGGGLGPMGESFKEVTQHYVD